MDPYLTKLKSVTSLETERLNLRPLRLQDASVVYAYASDPEVVRFLTFEQHQSLKESKNILKKFLMKPGIFLIELKRTLEGIGVIDMRIIPDADKASFGYALARSAWNQGYATEALYAVLKLAFDFLELNRVEAMHAADNSASGAVMRKCGMQIEGISRQSEKLHGKFHDMVHLAILHSDWLQSEQETL